MIQTILFDLDGTLTDSKPGILRCIEHALAPYGIRVIGEKCENEFMGPPLADALTNLYGFKSEAVNDIVHRYRELYEAEGMYENKPYDGITTVLETLRLRGKRLFVATSKLESAARKILDHFELTQYFETVCGATGQISKKHEVIAALIEKGIIDLQTTLMIGDRRYDILGAKQNGLQSAGVLYGYGSESELTEAGADFLIPTVSATVDTICGF